MDRYTPEKIRLLDLQLLGSVAFIVSIVISILLTYDEEQILKKGPRIFTEKQNQYLTLFNRILALGIVLLFLYINDRYYAIGKENKEPLPPLKHQIWASWASVASAIIVLYVVLENWQYNPTISTIENPTI